MPFDPTHPQLPEAIQSPSSADSAVVVLLDAGSDRRWAADTAIELCAAWARSGRRIVLADLHLENPILHERVGGTNLEGVVDIFLYGASLARSARPVEGRGFYLISAGTYTPDAEAIFAHPRWEKLITGFRDADASLVLFVPEETGDLTALGAWTREVVILGGSTASAAASRAHERGFDVRSALVPLGTELESEPPAVVPALDDFEDDATFQELEQLEEYDGSGETISFPDVDFGWATPQPDPGVDPPAEPPLPEVAEPALPPPGPKPLSETRSEAPPAGSSHAAWPDLDRDIELPPPPVRRRPERRRGLIALLWFLLAILLIGAAGFAASRLRPDLLPWVSSSRSPSLLAPMGAEPAAPAASTAASTGEPLPYSVQVKAFTSLAAAIEQVTAERRRFTEAPLFISPEEIQGILYYRILAGLAQDTVGAVRVREQLVAAGSVDPEDAAGTWSLIQYTPLAYELGEFDSPEAAAAAADSLRAQEIPAYPVALPYSDGSRRWRLYGGAFRDSTSAEKMRQMLEAAGVQPRLVSREGAPAVGDQ